MQQISDKVDFTGTELSMSVQSPKVDEVKEAETSRASEAKDALCEQTSRADSGWKGFVNYFLDGLSG